MEAGEHIVHVIIERCRISEKEEPRNGVNGVIVIVRRAVSKKDRAGINQSHSRARAIEQLLDSGGSALIAKEFDATVARGEHFQTVAKVVIRLRAEFAHLLADFVPIALVQVAELQRRFSLSAEFAPLRVRLIELTHLATARHELRRALWGP